MGLALAESAGCWVLLLPSQGLWFLPAGLRLAALWLIPAKCWVWLFIGEGLVGCILLWRTEDLVLDMNFVALSFVPWLVYASVMYLIRGREHEDEKTALYRISQTVTRQAIAANGIKKLTIAVQMNAPKESDYEESGYKKSGNEVSLIIETESASLKAIYDRVLALDGEYEVLLHEQSLTHRITFQQKNAADQSLPI